MIKFKSLVLITSLLIAGCAAFFSVYGIGLLFSGAIVAAMIMAGSLELGKLVTTTWLFRYWNVSNALMKTYMIIAILILMGVTSLGIFGYLSAAFQKSYLETELAVNKITVLETRKSEETKKLDNIKSTLDKLFILRSSQEARLSETLTNVLISRNPIQLQNIQNQIGEQIGDINKQMEFENVKSKDISEKVYKIDEDVFKLKIGNSLKKDITTFKFVADEFNTNIKVMVKWFILILITVFDPLAIVLLLAYNKSSNSREKSEYEIKYARPSMIEKEVIKEVPVDVERIVEKEVIKEVPVDVERIVEKEVIKEVPVEKIVTKRTGGGRGMYSF